MSDHNFIVLYRFRYLFCGLLIVVSLLLLSLVLSMIDIGHAQATSGNTNDSAGVSYSDNANIITDGFNTALETASKATDATLSAIQEVNNSVKQLTGAAVASTVSGGEYAARGVYGAALITVHGVGKSVSFAANTPAYAWHGATSVAHIGSFIKPAESDKTPIPQIEPSIAKELAGSKSVTGATPVVLPDDSAPQWPIHGLITEEFGVPHWPWQPIHTGIDISDGAAQGVTPIKPFKPGRVIVVVHSNSGFGNHVIIDHGDGLTSLYGHMYSTAVQVGQIVDKNTTLGYEGTTGASTGVHVHFELDLNSQPVNPHLYVTGQP
jgi:murein DD-endopeptidase MepM/ murein hydrolase activator NlpD